VEITGVKFLLFCKQRRCRRRRRWRRWL